MQQLSKYMKLKPPLYADEVAATRTEWKKQDMLCTRGIPGLMPIK